MNRARVAVLASGEGSNFEALVEAGRRDLFPGRVQLLLTDRACGAEERAARLGIAHQRIALTDRTERDAAMASTLRAEGIEWLCLAGFRFRIGEPLLGAFAGRTLNIHPSLLPELPGRDAVGRAHTAGLRRTGVTVHLVDAGIDTGPALLQAALAVPSGESLASLTARIHALEHRLFPAALRLAMAGAVRS